MAGNEIKNRYSFNTAIDFTGNLAQDVKDAPGASKEFQPLGTTISILTVGAAGSTVELRSKGSATTILKIGADEIKQGTVRHGEYSKRGTAEVMEYHGINLPANEIIEVVASDSDIALEIQHWGGIALDA